MASEIRTLKSGDTQVLPRTVSNAVTNTDGTTVQQHIDNKSNPHVVTIQQIGAAPDGFGLGDKNAKTKVTDLNAATANGWYKSDDANTLNAPVFGDVEFKYGWLFVTTGYYTRQDYYANLLDPIHFVRYRVDSNWTPWEVENPPMQIGVEYRTTERYKGKPVYARLLEVTGFGTPGTIAEVTVDVGNPLDNLVSYSAQVEQWAFPTFMYGGGSGTPLISRGNIQIEVRTTTGGTIEIYLYSESRDMSGETCYVQVKYTKAND